MAEQKALNLNSSEYSASQIQVLEGLEAVRMRPGMYIGTTSKSGLHHLVYEILDNAIDEALAGFCDRIRVTLHTGGSVSVSDNGRGIPVDEHELGVPAVQVVFTQLHAGGKFDDKSAYKISGGLHGVGASVVNALSSWLKVEVCTGGKRYQQEYREGGSVATELAVVGSSKKTGTTVTFKPDPGIFETTSFDDQVLAQRMQELAFLNAGLTLTLVDERSESKQSFSYDGGLVAFVKQLNRNKDKLHSEVIRVEGERDDIAVEAAIQYTKGYSQTILSFVNNIRTIEGGMHEAGFKTAVTRAVNDFAREKKLLRKKDDNLSGEDIREGMSAVLSLKVPDPQFEGQTKTKLGTSQARSATESVVYEAISAFLAGHYQDGKRLVSKAIDSMRARQAAKRARQLTRKKSGLESSPLTAKLADCSNKNPAERELFLVEGDSAGGSAKQGRDRSFQAVLPLRGKIINVEKNRLDRALKNNEIKTIVAALKVGVGEEIDMDQLAYERVIIMTDADTDGSHIRTLLLTLFFRTMRPLVEQGHVFIAQPPLYRIEHRSKVRYAYTEREMRSILDDLDGKASQVSRYKGLGEMNPEQLWATTMDPERRTLVKVMAEDMLRADQAFTVLMGSKVRPRRRFIQENALNVSYLDV